MFPGQPLNTFTVNFQQNVNKRGLADFFNLKTLLRLTFSKMLIKQNLQTDFCYETFHTSCTQPVGQSPGGRGCLIKINMIQKT